jgi:transposase-like protein
MDNVPSTLQEAVIHFADFENCKNFMVALRWPDGKVLCPHCGSDDVDYLPNARVFKCYQKHPLAKFSLKVGTVFEDSPLGLDKWLPVMWMLVNCKNGVSSWEIHRAIGVTQKTAWFMLQRARLAVQDPQTGGKLSGEVEVDETFIGAAARNMHADVKERKLQGRRGGTQGKAIVAAVLERGGKVRAKVVDKRKKKDLQALVRDNVEPGSALYSDSLKSYDGLAAEYEHQVIDHAEAYVDGQVHTNGMENFWSLLKRGLNGTYVSVEPFHLFRYVDEQAFRFNTRKDADGEMLSDRQRFVIAMKQIVGKRLTYSELIGVGAAQTEGS